MKQILDPKQIHEGVRQLAAEVKAIYGNQPLTIVAILTGSLVLTACYWSLPANWTSATLSSPVPISPRSNAGPGMSNISLILPPIGIAPFITSSGLRSI